MLPSGASSRPGTLVVVKRPVPSTPPAPEKPVLSDVERAKRLELLAERLRSRDGLDHDTLAQIEQLTADEQ